MDAFAVFVEHIIIYKHARAVIDASHIFVQIVASLALDTDVLAVTDHAVWNVVLAQLARLRVIVSKVHHRTAEAILALILIHEVPIFALRTQAIALALDAILQAGRFVAQLAMLAVL